LLLFAFAAPAAADPFCRTVEFRFAPGSPNMQIAVWVEDLNGKFIDTVAVTGFTGQFGLGNRPGTPLLKTDFRWPYGRREMVLPVWAHRRNHPYPKVLMGGYCGNSVSAICPDTQQPCGGDCDDTTIAYHSRVSSYEPFYCSPSGASKIDAMSCASKGTFSKGAYADKGTTSFYPPRADLNAFSEGDGADAMDFANQNDLVAISQATPMDGVLVDPAITWFPNNFPDGDYVAWIEMSQESDFNQHHNHPNQPDTVQAWDFEGHPFLGQPSILYKVQFHLGQMGDEQATSAWAGYGSWDGSTGFLNKPDNTISDAPGTGAGRLLDVVENGVSFRFKTVVGTCIVGMPDGGVPQDAGMSSTDGGSPDMTMMGPTCTAPGPVSGLKLTPTASSITVDFNAPTTGMAPKKLVVRYHEGTAPITDANFNTALHVGDLPPGTPGAAVETVMHGVLAQTQYTIGVRAETACGTVGPVAMDTVITPAQQFVTLNGCFVATATYGTPMAGAVAVLRNYRDRRLLPNPAGRLFVAAYYAFSPPLAAAIAGDARLRALSRKLLAPLVAMARNIPSGPNIH
jgi:hypothetical protein